MFPANTRILFADDAQTSRHLLRHLLGQLGFDKLFEATDGTEAFKLLSAQSQAGEPIELIISD